MKTGTNNRRRTALSRREFLRLTGAGGGTILLAACGAQGGTGATGSAAPAGASGAASAAGASAAASAAGATEKTLVSFWTPGGSETFCQGFETIASNFEALNPDIDIGETQCGTGEQSFDEVLLARIAAGNPPDATVLWTSPIGLAARGSLEPLDELMASSQYSQVQNWPEGVLASCQYGGKTYGLPATAGAYSLFYNQELFESKGIPTDRESFPKTWDELRALSKEFTVYNGDTLESVGFVPVLEPGSRASTSPTGRRSTAARSTTQPIRPTRSMRPNVEMMEYLLSWLDEEYKGDYAKLLQTRRILRLHRRAGPAADVPERQTGDPGAGHLVHRRFLLGDRAGLHRVERRAAARRPERQRDSLRLLAELARHPQRRKGQGSRLRVPRLHERSKGSRSGSTTSPTCRPTSWWRISSPGSWSKSAARNSPTR